MSRESFSYISWSPTTSVELVQNFFRLLVSYFPHVYEMQTTRYRFWIDVVYLCYVSTSPLFLPNIVAKIVLPSVGIDLWAQLYVRIFYTTIIEHAAGTSHWKCNDFGNLSWIIVCNKLYLLEINVVHLKCIYIVSV